MYKIIDEKLGLASCSVSDLTMKQVHDFLLKWEKGASIETLTFFYDEERNMIVLNQDNKNYELYLDITKKYMGLSEKWQEEVAHKAPESRERQKAEQKAAGNETEKSNREKALDVRELRIMAREKLFDEGLPASLADVLRYDDEKSLKTAIDAIKTLNPESPKAWGQRQSGGGRVGGDPIRKAMGLDQKKIER